MVWMSAALGMPLPLLMRAVHASGFQLGLLSSAWQFAMLAQLPSALIVEKLSRRKPLWAVVSILHRALWATPAVLPFLLPERRDLWPMVIVLALATSNVLGQAGTGPWQSWMADLLPPSRAGRFWGRRQRIQSTMMVLGAFVFGWLLDTYSGSSGNFLGFQLVFGLAGIFGVSDVLIHCAVTEPALRPHPHDEPLWGRIIRPFRNPDFLVLTIGMGIWTGSQAMAGYTLGSAGFFSMDYVKEAFGATYSQASWIFIASGVSAVLWTPRIGHWMDHVGAGAVLQRLVVYAPLPMLGWLFVAKTRWTLWGSDPIPAAVVLMCLCSLVSGGLYAGAYLCQIRLTQACTNPEGRTLAMAVHWSTSGFIASLGPLAAGWIKDHLAGRTLPPWYPGGAPVSYYQLLVALHLVLAWAVALPLLRRIK